MRTVLKFVFLILGVIAILFATNFPLMLMHSNDTLKEIDIEDLKKKQISLKTYCDFTKSIFPKHIDGYLYSAIYYRNSVLVTLLESDRTGILGPASNFYASKYYINEAQKNLDVALLLNPENDYAIVINNDIRALREYVK